MAEDTLFIEVKALGYETIKQVEDAVKRLKAEVKGTSVGTDEYIRKEQQLLQVQEKKLDLNKRLMSSQAQMMQSYFRSGEAIRSNIIAGQNLGRVLQDLPYGFIGIANNIEPLLVSFRQLRAEAGSTGAALRSMFVGPAGMMIGVSALLAAIQLLPGLFKQTSSEVANLRERLAELRGDFAGLLAAKREQGVEAMAPTTMQWLMYSMFGITFEPSEEQKLKFGITGEEARKIRERESEQRRKEAAKNAALLETQKYQRLGAALSPLQITSIPRTIRPGTNLRGAGAPPVAGAIGAEIFTGIDAGWQDFISSMQAGISTLSQSIYQGIGGAFEAVFGEANSLLEILIKNFTQNFLGRLATRGFTSLLGLIPGVGPILEAAMGSSSGTNAGVIGTAVSSAMSNMAFTLQGQDIVLAYDKSKITRSNFALSYRE